MNTTKKDTAHFIKLYEKAIPDPICDTLIDIFESNVDKTFEASYRRGDQEEAKTDGHLELVLTGLKEDDESFNMFHSSLANLVENQIRQYIDEIQFWSSLYPKQHSLEHFKLKRYEYSKENVKYHTDADNRCGVQKLLTVLCYLNDVTDGGTLVFPDYDIRYPAAKGSIIIFPSTWMFPHFAEHPFSNSKYVMTTFTQYSRLCDNLRGACINSAHEKFG